MTTNPELPADFLDMKTRVASRYLETEDPIRQSGFSGGPARWRAERGAILDAVDADGSLLDIGCANGYLLESLRTWSAERGITLDVHGLERHEPLVVLARQRIGDDAIHHGEAWTWVPPRRYRYVYTMNDMVPRARLSAYLRRLATEFAEPGGRVIMGAYGSRSRNEAPFDVAGAFEDAGMQVAGTARGGDPPLTSFAWVDAPSEA